MAPHKGAAKAVHAWRLIEDANPARCDMKATRRRSRQCRGLFSFSSLERERCETPCSKAPCGSGKASVHRTSISSRANRARTCRRKAPRVCASPPPGAEPICYDLTIGARLHPTEIPRLERRTRDALRRTESRPELARQPFGVASSASECGVCVRLRPRLVVADTELLDQARQVRLRDAQSLGRSRLVATRLLERAQHDQAPRRGDGLAVAQLE